MTPLYQHGAFDYPVAMALATVLGIGFGFALERGGFGRATTLVAQFYGDNMRVFKVMFSAIVTTTVGLGILGGLGILDLSLIIIPGTWIVPAIVGGTLLGVGFVMSGYCPGTALVAAGSGHLDGMVALLGIMLGSLVFGFAYDPLEALYLSTDKGVITFVGLTGIPWQVLAVAVVGMAVAGFIGAEKVEAILAKKQEHSPPDVDPVVRNRVFVGFAVATVVGLLTLAVPHRAEAPAAHAMSAADVESVSPVELATLVTSGRDEAWVVDLRDPAACAESRVATALCRSDEDTDASFVAELPATRTLVVYGQGDVDELPPSVANYAGAVRVLRGGFDAWDAQLLQPPQPPEHPTAADIEAYRRRAELHAWLTGSQAPAAPVNARPTAIQREAPRRGGGC